MPITHTSNHVTCPETTQTPGVHGPTVHRRCSDQRLPPMEKTMQSQILRINRRTVLKTAGAATAVGISQPFVLYDAHAQTAVPVRLTMVIA